MTTEREFLAGILADPHDDEARLVYADWLEERGNPCGSYLHCEVEFSHIPVGDINWAPLRNAWLQSRRNVPSAWLTQFEQSPLLRVNPTRFPAGWISIDLPDYRPADGTYELYDISSIPPIDPGLIKGDFAWLRSLGQQWDRGQTSEELGSQIHNSLVQLKQSVTAAGMALPADFVRFFSSPELGVLVRSCTDCYFDLAAEPIKPFSSDELLIPFYRDSQDCVTWYLLVEPSGFPGVVASGLSLENELDLPVDEAAEQIWWCAPTFEAFLYRYWLENEIWFTLVDNDRKLRAMETLYLQHYQ